MSDMQSPAIDFDAAPDAMRRAMLDAIYEQATEHFWRAQAAIARRDWDEAEAQRVKHDECRKAFYEVEAAPVVGQA